MAKNNGNVSRREEVVGPSQQCAGASGLSAQTAPGAAATNLKVTVTLNGGRAIAGHEYLMNTRAVLVMAAHLEKRGLANIRAAYPELDRCIANADRMVRNGGSVNARSSVVAA